MKAWRMVLLTLSFLMLGGCLVTFGDPLPANQTAPKALLGKWSSKDAWGEPLKLSISRAAGNSYKALATAKGKPAEDYVFTVARHGSRWYLSAGVPKRMGANFAIGGFELTQSGELVLFNLDVERIRQAIAEGELAGNGVEMPQGEGVLVTSSLDKVFAYLNDPANSDLFVEVARYQRSAP